MNSSFERDPRSPAPNAPTTDPHLLGTIMFPIGAALIYFCEVSPLLDGMHHLRELGGYLSAKGTALGFVLFFLGGGLFFWGLPVWQFLNPPPGKSKALGVIATMVVAGAGFALHLYTLSYLKSQGYVSRY